ncbi:zinc finger MYND domain-containing protein, partial [archaeon]
AVTSSSARDRGAAAESMESKESKESKEAGDVHDVRDSSAHELLTAEPAPARSILRILPDAADAAASASATGGRASATGAPPCSSAESGNAKEAEGEEAAWARVSEHIGRTVFSPTASAAALRRLTSVWGDDAAMEELLGQPKCNKCGAEAPRRCARCKNIWYCSRECQVADWPSHKPMCDVVAAHALPHD